VGEVFRTQAVYTVQNGAGKALDSVIAEGDFRLAFADFFKPRFVRSKSVLSVPP